MLKKRYFWILIITLILGVPLKAQFNLIHSFTGSPADGRQPWGSLIASGSVLYGMTEYGGAYDAGIVFKINIDGTGFSILHSFTGSATDGANPWGSLILIDSTLYGLTEGGPYYGTLFKINTDGTGFSLLHSFSGGDGRFPLGSLIAIGSELYGMASEGGTNFSGTIFKKDKYKINTDGTGFSVIHYFAGYPYLEGNSPMGSLIANGSELYGMTRMEGIFHYGTVFKVNTDGTGFMLLHSFNGSVVDGGEPIGDLILSGSTLYGMTSQGGMGNIGALFKVNTDGTGFALLRSFDSDGCRPRGALIAISPIFYGMTRIGGVGGGTIFQINKDGTGYTCLHTFAADALDGREPYGNLLLNGARFYGMTSGGGAFNYGVIFSQEVSRSNLDQILTINSNTGGTTHPNPGSYFYDKDLVVNILAIADTGYRFGSWSGDRSGASNPVSIIMNSDKTVSANFIRQFSLTVNANAGGTTNPAPGTYSYDGGTSITIQANANAGYEFSVWTGDVDSSQKSENPLNIILNSNQSVTANFLSNIYPPINVSGQKVINRSLSQAEYINILSWQANPNNKNISNYKIYLIENGERAIVTTLSSTIFEYRLRKADKNKEYNYLITAINSEQIEGDPAYVTIR